MLIIPVYNNLTLEKVCEIVLLFSYVINNYFVIVHLVKTCMIAGFIGYNFMYIKYIKLILHVGTCNVII